MKSRLTLCIYSPVAAVSESLSSLDELQPERVAATKSNEIIYFTRTRKLYTLSGVR
jgi:hypothetical protein